MHPIMYPLRPNLSQQNIRLRPNRRIPNNRCMKSLSILVNTFTLRTRKQLTLAVSRGLIVVLLPNNQKPQKIGVTATTILNVIIKLPTQYTQIIL